MKSKFLIVVVAIVLTSCSHNSNFSENALNETFTNLNNEQIAFKDILEQFKGKTIVVDVWASWCGDCIKGLPKFKKLQYEEKDVIYLMLSLDRSVNKWKDGIERFDVIGEHYFITKGWNGSEFFNEIGFKSIPRYLVIGKDGTIKMNKRANFSMNTIKKIIASDK